MESVGSVSFEGQNYGLQIGTNNASITAQIHPPNLDDILPMVHGAAFDSYSDQHENECLPGTRTEILHQIREWAFSPYSRGIFWLNGMAGTGKSTIARSVAASFHRTYKSLGASFFFKRGEADRTNAVRLFPTIVRQLAMHIPQILPCIQKIVHDNPEIATKTMKEQFNKLLFQPLLSLKLSGSIRTWIIVIDALDECEPDNDIRLMLHLLPQLQKVGSIRLRVFLTSRPELALELGFSRIANDHTDMVLHNIPKGDIEHDISLYFDHQLSEIQTERHLPLDWPGETNIQKLVKLSIPLFISAVTICRVLNDPFWDPLDSLTEILAHQNDNYKLAGMYLPVLNRLLRGQDEKQRDKLIHDFRQIIGAIVVLERPLSVASLSKLLDLPESLIHRRLNPLHSILSVPEGIFPVRLLHLSFRDFLFAPRARESLFGMDEKVAHHKLTLKCFSICQNLKKNICGLSSDASKRTEVDRQATTYPSPALQYACRYWAHHLSKCIELQDILSDALSFLRNHFLHWVEVMSILGLISEVVGAIQILQEAIGTKYSAITEFLQDAKRFVLKNRHIAEEVPLQLYCSGLIFAPRLSVIRRQSLESQIDLPSWINRLPQVEENWTAELQILAGHSGVVNSVAFSPSGQLLASGFDDKTIRIWEAATGTLLYILRGHSTEVTLVAFSPNSQLLVSCSIDRTVRLWETKAGARLQTIKVDSGVKSVAISPNGRLLATGSEDGTARVWEIATGKLLQALYGEFRVFVVSVTFSPNNSLLAVCSTDRKIRLWDITINDLQQILEDEYQLYWPVTFSPDDRLMKFGYAERYRLWKAMMRSPGQPIESYNSSSYLLAFSSDRQILAYCEYGKVAYTWDTTAGSLQQTLEGHFDFIESMDFSPDGKVLVSGSVDNTVRLWDTATVTRQHTLEDHSDRGPDYRPRDARSSSTETSKGPVGSVLSVAFSFNGHLLASGADDGIVRIWDVTTRAILHTIRSTGQVISVAFSPVDWILASASDRLRLWDIMTGKLRLDLHAYPGYSEKDIQSLVFSPDGRLLASIYCDQFILWDTMTGTRKRTLHLLNQKRALSATFPADGRLFASSFDNGKFMVWETKSGEVFFQSATVVGIAMHLEFSEDGSFLHSNLGSLHIQSKRFDQTSNVLYPEISIVQEQWVALNGKEVLWLPPEYRPLCSGVRDNLLALGHQFGRVSIIGFSI